MWKNYLRIVVRGIWKNKVFASINIFGLAMGLACSLLMLLYVQYEFSYDRHHENYDRIYRTTITGLLGGNLIQSATSPYPLAATLTREFPEIEEAARLRGFFSDVLISVDNIRYQEDDVFHADPSLFDIFTYTFIEGDPETALDEPNTVVLSQTIANKYFPNGNAFGQQLTFNNDRNYRVVGVVEDMPDNSHFHVNVLVSFTSDEEHDSTNWVSNNIRTYFLLREGSSSDELARKLQTLVTKYVAPQIEAVIGINIEEFLGSGGRYEYELQSLSYIHLNSNLDNEIETNGNINYVYTFLAVGLFVLLLACINFMNLSTARSSNRAKEIGVRKVMGAQRPQLVVQFLTESIVLSFIALIIALPMIAAVLPAFNAMTDKSMTLETLFGLQTFLLLIGFTLLVGCLSGSYPALFLSRFSPHEMLKGKLSAGAKNSWFRSVLVVMQFAISIALVAATLVVYEQLNFMREKSLGFDQDQVVVIRRATALGDQLDSFKNVVSGFPNVVNITSSAHVPGESTDQNVYSLEGRPANESKALWSFSVDFNYIETLAFEMIEGRGFSEEFGSDENGYVLNEAAVTELGISENPTAYRIVEPDPEEMRVGPILGVVKDFHFQSLHEEIRPMLFRHSNFARYVVVRIGANNVTETLAQIQQQWNQTTNNQPFEYSFLDEDFESLHEGDQRLGQLFTGFAGFAIFIACLGLYGLASYTTELRTKEIGIRKTLGASVSGLVLMISKDFMILVAIALAAAVPIIIVSMNQWLGLFSYRIDLPMLAIVISGITAIAVAFLTVSIESLRAALTNPVQTLRDE